jgi:hypothetical protein
MQGFTVKTHCDGRTSYGRGATWSPVIASYETMNATIMATIASVREMPSTQRTTPVVRPCRASVAVFTVGRPSDIAAIPLLR